MKSVVVEKKCEIPYMTSLTPTGCGIFYATH